MSDITPASDKLSVAALDGVTEEQVQEAAPEWYTEWRQRVYDWLKDHTDDAFADLALLVPDLFALIVRLANDRRVPFLLKGQLVVVAAYVLSPVDLIPEAALGVIGLTDDISVMTLLLWSIKNVSGIDPRILQDNWSGKGDISEIVEQLRTTLEQRADQLFRDEKSIWQTIKRRFGGDGGSAPKDETEG